MQNKNKYIAYFRVSTQKQGRSGLGIEGQKGAVNDYIRQYGGNLIAEYQEIESGKDSNRPELNRAVEFCELSGGVLLVAKLDRLSRDLHFITSLQKRGLKFKFCDMPEIDELTIHVLGATAQHELRMISNRTITALAVARKRGIKLGNPYLAVQRNRDVSAANHSRVTAQKEWQGKIIKIIEHLEEKESLKTCKSLANALNERGLKTLRGGAFSVPIVSRIRRKQHG